MHVQHIFANLTYSTKGTYHVSTPSMNIFAESNHSTNINNFEFYQISSKISKLNLNKSKRLQKNFNHLRDTKHLRHRFALFKGYYKEIGNHLFHMTGKKHHHVGLDLNH